MKKALLLLVLSISVVSIFFPVKKNTMEGTEAIHLNPMGVEAVGPELIGRLLPMQHWSSQLLYHPIQSISMAALPLIPIIILQAINGQRFQGHHHLLLQIPILYKHR